jgi:hypothetical protein
MNSWRKGNYNTFEELLSLDIYAFFLVFILINCSQIFKDTFATSYFPPFFVTNVPLSKLYFKAWRNAEFYFPQFLIFQTKSTEP